jgi:endonuclease/exonuclease/phosphatase family metal-dependent hydrolase
MQVRLARGRPTRSGLRSPAFVAVLFAVAGALALPTTSASAVTSGNTEAASATAVAGGTTGAESTDETGQVKPQVEVPENARSATLGADWKSSADRAWTTSGDGDGFHLMIADADQGYRWRTVATLSEPGIETDQWIGNVCLTGSGRRAVVAYAPRTFTNKEALFDRGAFTAVVDLKTGTVRKLTARTSLAYFNPSCGAAEKAVLTQAGDTDLGRTRLLELDAATATVSDRIEIKGQLTSPVPTTDGIVAADSGALVRVSSSGKRQLLASTRGVPFRVATDAEGGVVYMEQTGNDSASVRRVALRTAKSAAKSTAAKPVTLASGGLSELEVTSSRGGQVFVTGARQDQKINASVSLLDVPAGSAVSTEGDLALTSTLRSANADPRVPVTDPAAAQPVDIKATALTTDKAVTFSQVPTAGGDAGGAALTPALAGPAKAGTVGKAKTSSSASKALAAADPDDPADTADRYCSVPRNDPRNQAMQPKPRQVEWAVDQAVRNSLSLSRPANWKNLGMPAYSIENYFPPVALNGGGNVPAQVMLGITAQESNMWQAARFAVPGVTANPLIGNYYGLDVYNNTEADDWTIEWDKADCGYGVTQVTDGMRRAGREKPGEQALPYDKQRAIALDFAANVAAGVNILKDKWNQTRGAGMTINNGNPAKPENWFYAVWAYNSGFYPQSDAPKNSGAWGVGWGNNPANPKYPAGRTPFLDDTMADASHPHHWPYPEKIMGWAGHPVEILEAPDSLVAGYRAAFWNGNDPNPADQRRPEEQPGTPQYNRYQVKPPVNQFCNASNECEPGAKHPPQADGMESEPAGPCASRNEQGQFDLHCWYHGPSTWKTNCPQTCGNEVLRFNPGYAYQDDGTAYPPSCSLSGLPATGNIYVVDNVPPGTPAIRPNCANTWTSSGSFKLSWPQDGLGKHPGKIDTHQLGVGFGGHIWMTNARPDPLQKELLSVTGTWTFNTSYTGMGRVWVALPDTGAGDAKTTYEVKTKRGWRQAHLQQKSSGTGNRWVSLGVFEFGGEPQLRLSTKAPDGNGTQRVAFDAAVFETVTPETVSVLHWNLAGATERNRGDYLVVDRMVQEVLAKQPDVVTVNETCMNQFDNLGGKLAQAGYRMDSDFVTSQTINHGCANAGDIRLAVGNGVLVRGEMKSNHDYVFGQDGVLRGTAETLFETDRVVGCLTARITGTTKDTKICTTHLAQENRNQSPWWVDAQAQTRELTRFFASEAKTRPFILTGDFNIPTPPEDPALRTLYSGTTGTGEFHEGFEERACDTAATCEIQQGGPATQVNGEPGVGNRKLDYIFADRRNFTVPSGKASVNPDRGLCANPEKPECSDHFMSYAEFRMAK